MLRGPHHLRSKGGEEEREGGAQREGFSSLPCLDHVPLPRGKGAPPLGTLGAAWHVAQATLALTSRPPSRPCWPAQARPWASWDAERPRGLRLRGDLNPGPGSWSTGNRPVGGTGGVGVPCGQSLRPPHGSVPASVQSPFPSSGHALRSCPGFHQGEFWQGSPLAGPVLDRQGPRPARGQNCKAHRAH